MAEHLQRIVFQAWPKIPRLNRDMVVTEKIDGTNAAVGITEHPFGTHVDGVPGVGTLVLGPDNTDFDNGGDGLPDKEYIIYAQSRRRLISPDDDNYGFARWVDDNATALVNILGPGVHFGEWWGAGIQRGYGLSEKRFSLFNTHRWHWLNDPAARESRQIPESIQVVPVLRHHTFATEVVHEVMDELALKGSQAAPGYMEPEGVVVYHTASQSLYKALLDGDDRPKGQA